MPNPAEVAWLKRLGIPNRTAVPNGQNRATTPNVPAVPAAPPPPNNRPKAGHLFTCDECGGAWHLEHVNSMTKMPATFCPSCGTKTLHTAPDAFAAYDGLRAVCFQKLRVERMLAQLLYEQWATNAHAEQQKHPRYVDYLRAQLAGE